MKISLIGPMASGKTTIGQALADKFNLPFYSTDALIEAQAGMPIIKIFANAGEAHFRDLETKILTEVLSRSDDLVLATGGGVVKAAENRALLLKHSHVIFLDISVGEQMQRTEGDTSRPLLNVPNKEQILQTLWHERRPWFEEIAHQTLLVDGLKPEEVLALIQIPAIFNSFFSR